MIYITKAMKFSASHRIYNPNLSEEENFQLFKQCANKNGHGHNYLLEVSVKGNINKNTGYVIDLKELKCIIQREVISLVDHRNLNIDVTALKDVIPTSENLVILFWNLLENKIPNAELYKIKLCESDTSWVEYYGEN
jgi:6-pyruvoyltetrahydropterin/6-carboxytetrahydropterin synthase